MISPQGMFLECQLINFYFQTRVVNSLAEFDIPLSHPFGTMSQLLRRQLYCRPLDYWLG